MTVKPDISVVMSVYNGEEYLYRSVDSILMQKGVNLELIIVNDGSTDNSRQIIEKYGLTDKRVRLINQENRGLTQALITGCFHAQGEYIARHDVGDVSSPIRLKKQLACIKKNPDASMVSGDSRFVGPGNEHLYDVRLNPQNADSYLKTLRADKIRGPSHHGCTLFPKKLYSKVGGYRSEFYFAQDLDLWVRLAEKGRHIIIPEIFYSASVSPGSISGKYRKEQIKLTRLILECARRRRNNEDESAILEKASMVRPSQTRQRNNLDQAKVLYFIGRCLQRNCNLEANKYFKKALAVFPLHLKSAIRLLLSRGCNPKYESKG